MTEKEIVQALRYCSDQDCIDCAACKYFGYGDCLERLVANAADLIERLTAENAALREKVYSMSGEWCAMMSVLNSLGSHDRLRELAEADKDGRVVVLPCRGDADIVLMRNGIAFKPDHWNIHLTAFAENQPTPSGKKVALFDLSEVQESMEGKG